MVRGHRDDTGFRFPSRIGYIACYAHIVAGETRYPVVKKMLEAKGHVFTRIAGSRHVFTKPGVPPLAVPVHHGKVEPALTGMALW